MARSPANPFVRERRGSRAAPQQPRAGETVEKIKAAMLALIEEEGYAAASTNRVARRAKVNIASLYRYFPNRAAIALALYEEATADLAQRVHRGLIGRIGEPLEAGLPKLITEVVEFLGGRQLMLDRLIEQVPELRESSQAMELENLARSSSRVYLEHHIGKLDAAELQCRLFFVQHFAMGLIRRYVSERPSGIPRERFVAELTALLLTYLRRDQTLDEALAAVRRA